MKPPGQGCRPRADRLAQYGVATDLRHPQRNDLPDEIHFTLASLTIVVKPELITTTAIPTRAIFILISKSSKEVLRARFLASDGGRFV